MARPIEHSATVLRAQGDVVEVELTVRSACAACHARTVCAAGESERKRIAVSTPEAAAYAPGEEVVVSVERNMGMTAVLWAYVMPFVVLSGGLVAAASAGWSDGTAAAVSLGAVGLYYAALYAARGRLERKIHFKIHKQ